MSGVVVLLLELGSDELSHGMGISRTVSLVLSLLIVVVVVIVVARLGVLRRRGARIAWGGRWSTQLIRVAILPLCGVSIGRLVWTRDVSIHAFYRILSAEDSEPVLEIEALHRVGGEECECRTIDARASHDLELRLGTSVRFFG